MRKKQWGSLLLCLALLFSLLPTAAAADADSMQAAEALYQRGLFQGIGTGADGRPDFDLDSAPTRAQATVMLVRLLGKQTEAMAGGYTTPFADVPSWAAGHIGYAYQNGLTRGISADAFGANLPISASQYLTLTLRAMGYQSETDFAWDSAWTLSDKLGFTSGEYHSGSTNFTRGDVAKISYRALSAKTKAGALLGDTLPAAETPAAADDTRVHFINVGQADSILVQSGGQNMLIDGGNNQDGAALVAYLKGQGIDRFAYVVGTHPHEDHIGGLDDVVSAFAVERVLLPDKVHTTKTYADLIDAIEQKGLSVTVPQTNQSFSLGKGQFTVVSPQGAHDNLNDYSLVLRFTAGAHSFLFAGDAEVAVENTMIASGMPLQAEVLKVGHHGSTTSTGEAFLQAVAPRYAVISVGADNRYGHPDPAILDRLAAHGIEVYRTDLQGTIIATDQNGSLVLQSLPNVSADGGGTLDTTKPDPAPTPSPEPSGTHDYVLNTNSKTFHLPDCSAAAKISDKNRATGSYDRAALIDQGYKPCGICKP